MISGRRVYVHLSDNLTTSITVGRRHSPNPVILKINEKKLVKSGQAIKKVGKETYITDIIDPKFISINK